VTECIDRPKVKIVSSELAEPLSEDAQYLLDLSDKKCQDTSVDLLLLDYNEQ